MGVRDLQRDGWSMVLRSLAVEVAVAVKVAVAVEVAVAVDVAGV